MAEITGERKNIQVEEVRYKSSVSEAVGFKLGSSINFINNKQYDHKGFYINGNYSLFSTPILAVDGAIAILNDCEIIGVCMFNIVAGSAGTTTLNVRRYTGSNTPSGGESIFDVKPSISFTAGNNAFVFKRFLDDTTLENPSGTTLPTLAISQLNAGDLLVVDLDAAQTNGQNCGLLIFLRPR
jgi:hypothetical protein